MAKYLLFYKGGDQPKTDEEGQAVMQLWTSWFTGLGAAVADPGNPFGPSKTVTPSGDVVGENSGGSGYSVLEAADLDAAVAMAQTCPHLAANGSVEVYETFNVM